MSQSRCSLQVLAGCLSLAITGTASAIPVTDGLIAYYSFDEPILPGAVVVDSSGNGNIGYIKNGVTIDNGLLGKAAFFDGIDSKIAIPNTAAFSSNELTISTWVKTTSDNIQPEGNGWSYLVAKGQAWDYQYTLQVRGESNQLDACSTTSGGGKFLCAETSYSSISDGEWHSVVGVITEEYSKIYIDGDLKHTDNTPTGTWNINGAADLTIGGINSSSFGEGSFEGSIDDVAIYNRVLSVGSIYDQVVAEKVVSPLLVEASDLNIYRVADDPNDFKSLHSIDFKPVEVSSTVLAELSQASHAMRQLYATNLNDWISTLSDMSNNAVVGLSTITLAEEIESVATKAFVATNPAGVVAQPITILSELSTAIDTVQKIGNKALEFWYLNVGNKYIQEASRLLSETNALRTKILVAQLNHELVSLSDIKEASLNLEKAAKLSLMGGAYFHAALPGGDSFWENLYSELKSVAVDIAGISAIKKALQIAHVTDNAAQLLSDIQSIQTLIVHSPFNPEEKLSNYSNYLAKKTGVSSSLYSYVTQFTETFSDGKTWEVDGDGTATIEDGKLVFKRGSPVWAMSTIPGSESPFVFSFDYFFTEADGFLDLMLNDLLVASISAHDAFLNEWRHYEILLSSPIFYGANLDVAFYTDGPHGSLMYIDNLRIDVQSVPEPPTVLLMLFPIWLMLVNARKH